VIQDALLAAVQAQPGAVLTSTLTFRSPASTLRDSGVMENEHTAAGAACVTVNGRPAIVIVPVRAAELPAA
jgi:hypothetical protein